MSATEYLRHPALLLAAVSVAIALAWIALGYPVAMPPAPLAPGEKLGCVSYAPVPPETSREEGISAGQIEADMARLAPYTSCVRVYMTGGGLDRLPEIARRHGMNVLQGVALGRDPARNALEIDQAIELARTQRAALRAFVVGTEVLSRGELTVAELAALIGRVRDATKLPVTYADYWRTWLTVPELARAVDFVTIQVGLYQADPPVPPQGAAAALVDARARTAARVGAKSILVETGWPSAGRMREAARPSPVNQARVLHQTAAAAKAANIPFNLFEGLDQRWRMRTGGAAAARWGLVDAESGVAKFRWGAAVSDHPLWFMQAVLGAMLAFVVFAAGFLAARSIGPLGPKNSDWRPVAGLALAGGLFIGWAAEEAPLQVQSIIDAAQSGLLMLLAALVPPVAAAAAVRGVPFESFGGLLDPQVRRAAPPLARAVSLLFVVVIAAAIQLALVLVFDPATREFPAAALTGPAVALLVSVLYAPPRKQRTGRVAETAAAAVLAGAAMFIAFNETFWNWQALWFAAVLLVLAASCWRARGAPD